MNNFWDFSVWGSFHLVAVLLVSLLAANVLKRTVKFLRVSLIPTSVLGGAILLVLAEIYAARERNTVGISSADVAAQIPGSIYCETLPEVTEYLRGHVQPGDIVLTMGAGDIFRAGEALLK